MGRKIAKYAAAVLALLAVLVACQQVRHSGGPALAAAVPGGLRLATYNVHYILLDQSEGRWSAGNWENRKRPLDATFKALGADIVAFQEMESFAGGDDDSVNLARAWLLGQNPDFAAAATGDWRAFPSTQPIFYRTSRLEPVDQGWFFFSDTPGVIYSRTFDGSYPAFASWADVRDRDSGEVLRILNVHLDYSSRGNRRKSTELIAARVEGWLSEGRNVVLAGDLNARRGSSVHIRLAAAGLDFVPVPGASYHFDRGINLFGAIDHIALAPGVAPAGPAIVFREKLGEVWPTDHYPVVVDIATGRP